MSDDYDEPRRKVLECSVCDREFSSAEHLKVHYRTHTGEKPFECEVCGRAFARSDSLKRHLRIHMADDNYVAVNGQTNLVCDRRFTSTSQVIKIERSSESGGTTIVANDDTDDSPPPNKKSRKSRTNGSKPYTCDICLRCFGTNDHLKVHRRIHTGEKPYECEECGQKFARGDSLKRHYRIHTGEKPYECQDCGTKFALLQNLKKHAASHLRNAASSRKPKKKPLKKEQKDQNEINPFLHYIAQQPFINSSSSSFTY